MPRGGRITIRTAAARIDDEFARVHPPMRPGEYVELVVQDTGSGMDEETKKHLFEPFYTTKEPGKGTGLGLATVFGIIKQMGGFIWVRSEPDSGTDFSIQLPRSTRPMPGAREHARREGAPVGREQILLVEDDPDVRQFAAVVLRRFGYRVTEASTGNEALNRLREASAAPDLVITDVVMPGMSGPELARRLEAERAGVKVLFTSGYAGERIAPDGVLQEGMTLLEKPFTANTLLTRVRDVLDV
jgi:CheY-like chemotaxis protein